MEAEQLLLNTESLTKELQFANKSSFHEFLSSWPNDKVNAIAEVVEVKRKHRKSISRSGILINQ